MLKKTDVSEAKEVPLISEYEFENKRPCCLSAAQHPANIDGSRKRRFLSRPSNKR